MHMHIHVYSTYSTCIIMSIRSTHYVPHTWFVIFCEYEAVSSKHELELWV